MEKPYAGLTARVQLNGVTVGYLNSLELNLEKDIAEVLQFGAQYKEKLPTIKNWTASSEGTVAFAAGESQHKLYQAFESGEFVTLTIKLDEGVYFEGQALISSLSISGAPDDALSISVEFEGSGAILFTLPETVTVTISSGVGGTTNPAGVIRVAKGGTVTITCLPANGKTADKYGLNGAAPSETITGNAFTTGALSADTTIYVTFKNA
jgi:predicted secreted protein